MTLPPIGLSGFAGAGKTTAARFLEEEFGYTRLHIADPLRDMLRALMAHDYPYPEDADEILEGPKKEDLIPEWGVTSRYAQITLGTEWGRELINPNLWSDLWRRRAAKVDKPMNDSVRFPNEESAIRDLGGVTILIMRKGYGPAKYKWKRLGPLLYRLFGVTRIGMAGVHDSERIDRLKPDFVVWNDASVEHLAHMVEWIIDHAQHGYRRTTMCGEFVPIENALGRPCSAVTLKPRPVGAFWVALDLLKSAIRLP